MLIVLGIYSLVIWLLFFKLELLPWNKLYKFIVYGIGFVVIVVVIALLNSSTPSGTVSLVGRVVMVTPTVEGRIVEINVEPNQPIAEGDPLFKVDPAPYENTVNQLVAETALAETRLDQARRLATTSAGTRFRVEEAEATFAALSAQLEEARRKLSETVVRAPHDGAVTFLDINVGDWAMPRRSVMSFVVKDDFQFMATFSQTGFVSIKPGTPVRIALNSDPGERHETKVTAIPLGVGQGQIVTRGQLQDVGGQGLTNAYVVLLELPETVPDESLYLGMSGAATALPEDAGPIAVLAEILLFIQSWMMYL